MINLPELELATIHQMTVLGATFAFSLSSKVILIDYKELFSLINNFNIYLIFPHRDLTTHMLA